MKTILIILGLFLFTGFTAFAQDDDAEGNELIRQKMNEFIQKRLGLSKAESEKFTPVFIRYFKEWRETLRVHRGDNLVRNQKVAELQIRYRTEFRQILGEKRANQVYRQQKIFVDELINAQRRQQRDPRPNKKTGLLLQ
jgi:hypothetical protein